MATQPLTPEEELAGIATPEDELAGIATPLGAQPPPLTTAPEDRAGAFERFIGGVGRAIDPRPLVEMLRMGVVEPSSLLGGIVSAQREQFQKAGEAPTMSGERTLRTLAGAVPLLGPAAAGMYDEAVGEGNVAGVAGELAGAAIPIGGALGKLNRAAAGGLRSRGIQRALSYINPPTKAIRQVQADLRKAPGMITQLGHGDIETLAGRARGKEKAFGKQVEQLQGLEQPVDVTPVAEALEAEARKYETTTTVPREVDTGLLDPAGRPLTKIVDEEVTTSQYPAYGAEHRARAKEVRALGEQFGEEVPGGEAFKQRMAAGRAGTAAESPLPGQKTAPAPTAAKHTRQEFSKFLHEEFKVKPNSKAIDEIYSRWKGVSDALGKSHAAALKAGLKDEIQGLLMGRIGAKVLGATAGGTIGAITGGAGFAGAAAGALIGHTLSKSVFWNSLRAETYTKLATALRKGNHVAAAKILGDAVKAYNVATPEKRKPLGTLKPGGELGKLEEEEE